MRSDLGSALSNPADDASVLGEWALVVEKECSMVWEFFNNQPIWWEKIWAGLASKSEQAMFNLLVGLIDHPIVVGFPVWESMVKDDGLCHIFYGIVD